MSEYILVTGFGPFSNHVINASWEAVKLLPDQVNSIKIVKKEIRVEYDQVQSEIPLLWQQYKPLLVVHVGVSELARAITIEKCANRDGYTKIDCTGIQHATGTACETGSKCIFTEINVEEICDKVRSSKSVDVCTSTNAGRYLCEFIYYTSLNIDSSRTLFVHVPPLGKPYSAKQISEALYEIILQILKPCIECCKRKDKCQC